MLLLQNNIHDLENTHVSKYDMQVERVEYQQVGVNKPTKISKTRQRQGQPTPRLWWLSDPVFCCCNIVSTNNQFN